MTGVYATAYRPLRFAEVVGQAHIKPILQAMIDGGKVPPALLFHGTRGTGKTSMARIFSAALNCENPANADACGECAQCRAVQKANSTSVLEIDAASNGGVDEIRKIKELINCAHEAEWRVVLIDEAHSLSKEANNALLKTLEEPPPYTVFILVTTEQEKILGTVRSRAMPFEFRRIRHADLVERLRYIAKSEGVEASEDLFSEIAKTAQGGLRDAVMIFDQVQMVGVRDADSFRDFWGIQDYSLSLMWSALRGDFTEGYRLIEEHFSRTGEAAGMVSDLSRLVSELLVIKSEGRPANYAEEALAERVEMAGAAPTEAFVKVIEVLWELRNRTRATENDQHSSMDMGFALIANTLKPLHQPKFQPPQDGAPILLREEAPTQKLSLTDIANF